MDALLIPIVLTFIGCGTAIVLRGMSYLTNSRRLRLEEEVRMLRFQLEARDKRLAELERVNHHFEQQLEWQQKLLDLSPTPRQLDRGQSA